MKKFCTNCGHANEQDNKICVECGTSLTGEKENPAAPTGSSQPVKNKKPLSLKTKILSVVGILLVASLIGVYSWGTKTASADTVVANFFEALENEDAKALAKQTWLSNGQAMTVKEAEAFIKQFQGISPYELEDVATVEKNGKVIGIFDAHRVIIPVQTLSFNFPHEGLALNLNGELVAASFHEDGEYTFSDISPGYYGAEFLYEGEFAEFNYPFALEVYMYSEGSAIDSIYQELPVSSVTFKMDTYYSKDPEANKVVIGDKKIPVNENGESEAVGPLLVDGTTTAQAEITFPWGVQLSEPVEITSYYHNFAFTGLEEKQQTAIIDQIKVFAEEYVQAKAQRDSTIFTGVSKSQLRSFKEELDDMKRFEKYFKGSLIEVGIDEETISIVGDGGVVQVEVAFTINADNYYERDTPDLRDSVMDVKMDFIYDAEQEKWVVNAFNEDNWFLNVSPTIIHEGSGKVYESDGTVKAADEEAEESEDDISLSDEAAETFMFDYNEASVAAINAGDYSLVSSMVHGDGPRKKEQTGFIDQMYKKGSTEEHLSTTLESIEALGDGFYQVTTIEEFIIHTTTSSAENKYRTVTKVLAKDNEIYVYELISTKKI